MTGTQKWCLVVFAIGFIWCSLIVDWTQIQDGMQSVAVISSSSVSSGIMGPNKSHYEGIQRELIHFIKETQSNCSNKRVLHYEMMGDGFANIHHFVGHVLLIAVSSNRRLLIEGNFKYFGQCQGAMEMDTNWYCVYDALSDCSSDSEPDRRSLSQRAYGMKDAMQQRNIAEYFGNRDEVRYRWEPLVWSDGIFHQQWFHSLDALFIRSQIQWIIWNSLNEKSKRIIERHPMIQHFKSLKKQNRKFIAFHIRKSDNIRMVQRDFGVDGERVYSIEYYMQMMEEWINVDEEDITTIFVCTDNSDVIQGIEGKYRNQSKFDFVYNEKVKRNNTKEWTWFLENVRDQDLWDIIVDIEVMRTADYLIGSPTSNVYRLAMELNYATNWVQQQIQGDGRPQTIFSVDVPWYQSP